jgi:hypothetical protein
MGGSSLANPAATMPASMFSLTADNWPAARAQMAMAVTSTDLIYVFGGAWQTGVSNDMWTFSLSRRQWQWSAHAHSHLHITSQNCLIFSRQQDFRILFDWQFMCLRPRYTFAVCHHKWYFCVRIFSSPWSLQSDLPLKLADGCQWPSAHFLRVPWIAICLISLNAITNRQDAASAVHNDVYTGQFGTLICLAKSPLTAIVYCRVSCALWGQ